MDDCLTRKRPYETRRPALEAINKAAKYVDIPMLRVYKCPFCRKWHMTSQPLRESDEP